MTGASKQSGFEIVNRKQRRAEDRTGRTAGRPANPLEDTLFRQALAHHQAGHLREAAAGAEA